MSTYLLFAGPEYYPYGGGEDLVGVYPTEGAARSAVPTESNDFLEEEFHWANIVGVIDGEARVVSHARWDTSRGYDRAKWVWKKGSERW